MAFGNVEKFLVAAHTKLAPGEEEWEGWMEFCLRAVRPGEVMKVLIVTEGGAPSAAQRQVMNEKLSPYVIENPNALRNAIVTSSAFVRGVVTALSWFHPGHCAFSPANMDDAMAYLEVPVELRAELRLLVRTLQAQLAAPVDVKRPPDKGKV